MHIQHNKDLHRFTVEINGHTALVDYQLYDDALDIRKTLVPKEISGRGIAAALVKAAYDYAVEQKLKCLGTCSYAVVWLERHPEYNGQKSTDFVEGSCAVAPHAAKK